MADSAPIVLDHSHELFLHPSDHPNFYSLVSEPLTGSNYGQWKRLCEVPLVSKHKFGFVNGSSLNLLLDLSSLSGNVAMQWSFPGCYVLSGKTLPPVSFSAQLPNKFGMSLSCIMAKVKALKSFRFKGKLIISLREIFLFLNISLGVKFYGINMLHLFLFQLVHTLNVLLVLPLSNYLRISSWCSFLWG